MTLLRKIVSNRRCGLRWKEAARVAMLDWQVSTLMGRLG